MQAVRVCVFVCVIMAVSSCRPPQVAPTVTPHAIRSIEIGMTEQQVGAILGRPLQIRPWGPDSSIYDYAIPGWGASSASLWIYFRDGAVQEIQAKRVPFLGDSQLLYFARVDTDTFEAPDFEATFNSIR
jgi:hypothetical protein